MSIPNKIFDSLYFGLPIITSLKGELENLIKENNIGYFCDENFSWSYQINECINNPPIDKNNKVRMPGQNALLSRKKSIENGINLSKETLKSLEEIAKKFDIILNLEIVNK